MSFCPKRRGRDFLRRKGDHHTSCEKLREHCKNYERDLKLSPEPPADPP
jgi:hypothetical protein